MKILFKYIFQKILFIFYRLLVSAATNGKKTLPGNYVNNLYESFYSITSTNSIKKLLLPYIEVDNFNRHDLNRPYEVLPVESLQVSGQTNIKLRSTKDIILPIALLDKSSSDKSPKSLEISYANECANLQLLHKNRFHYLPIKSNQPFNNILINSNHNKITIGSPIYRDKPLDESKPKLIVHIFIDALSKLLIDSHTSELMPATKSFFSDGINFENSYSQADWTLSSMSGVFTGKYTKDHLIYHPRRVDKINDLTLAEVLNDEGYLTSLISAVPKITPLNGFDRGFRRFVVAPFKDANYIINEAAEQLDAFGGNQYMFLGLFDVHESKNLQPISSQVRNKLTDFHFKLVNTDKKLSILYDKERIAMYANTLVNIDSKLEVLYKKIKDYDQNALVVLHSDHGVDFITKNTQRLSNEREKVAFMIRGGNLKSRVDKSISEIRKLPSLILSASNIEEKINYSNDGFAKTESIYPNQEYELAIRDEDHVLFFQVPWKSFNDRQISDYSFTASLNDVKSEKRITNDIKFKVMLNIAKNHYVELINNLIASEVD